MSDLKQASLGLRAAASIIHRARNAKKGTANVVVVVVVVVVRRGCSLNAPPILNHHHVIKRLHYILYAQSG